MTTGPDCTEIDIVERERSLTVIPFRIDGADKGPVEVLQDVDHSACLKVVGRDGPCEVLEAALVAQCGAGRGVADLWDLEQAEEVRYLQ